MPSVVFASNFSVQVSVRTGVCLFACAIPGDCQLPAPAGRMEGASVGIAGTEITIGFARSAGAMKLYSAPLKNAGAVLFIRVLLQRSCFGRGLRPFLINLILISIGGAKLKIWVGFQFLSMFCSPSGFGPAPATSFGRFSKSR